MDELKQVLVLLSEYSNNLLLVIVILFYALRRWVLNPVSAFVRRWETKVDAYLASHTAHTEATKEIKELVSSVLTAIRGA